MQSSNFPDSDKLQSGLEAALFGSGIAKRSVSILDRKQNPFSSTFPTEIVTCRIDLSNNTQILFVKYGKASFDGVFKHRGNVSYEAKVYRNVLRPLKTSAPNFYGVYRDKRTHTDWLIIEYLPGGHRASWTRDPQAMIRSARWIGRFHAANEGRVSGSRLRFLRRYDFSYYVGWARRTSQFFNHRSKQLQARFPWIPHLCEEFEESLPSLTEAPRTVIHGECFGSNIVYQNGISHPIDWQSAAVAPGEIDLASLTLAWPKPFVEKLEREYEKSRWPTGTPYKFRESLEIARLYMGFRWLGDTRLMSQWFRPGKRFVIPKDPKRIITELYTVGQRLGMIHDTGDRADSSASITDATLTPNDEKSRLPSTKIRFSHLLRSEIRPQRSGNYAKDSSSPRKILDPSGVARLGTDILS